MNTKAIIASTLLSAIITSTAIAGDNDYVDTSIGEQVTQSFVITNAYLLTATIEPAHIEEETSR